MSSQLIEAEFDTWVNDNKHSRTFLSENDLVQKLVELAYENCCTEAFHECAAIAIDYLLEQKIVFDIDSWQIPKEYCSSLNSALDEFRFATAEANPNSNRCLFRAREIAFSGGTSVFWNVFDPSLRRYLVAKEPRRPTKASIDQLKKEGVITASFAGQSVVPVHSILEVNGTIFMLMERVRGEAFSKCSSLPLRRKIGLVLEVLIVLSNAHEQGIFHLDLKPENVMVDKGERALLIDFGISKFKTDQSLLGGTYEYMAPEQRVHLANTTHAKGSTEVCELTDVFLAGGLIYWVLTDCPPFPTGEYTSQISFPTKNHDKRLAAICRRAMSHNKSDRYPTAEDLKNDLRRWLDDEPITACRDGLFERFFRWSRKHKTASVASIVALLLTLVLGSVVFLLFQQLKHNEALAQERLAVARTLVEPYFEMVSDNLDVWRDVDNKCVSPVLADSGGRYENLLWRKQCQVKRNVSVEPFLRNSNAMRSI
jgi:serine/threonine protein kinase